jgi:hypothetical protein
VQISALEILQTMQVKTQTPFTLKGVKQMARIPMVTRTIPTTVVNIFCCNTEDRTTFDQSITLPRTYKDEVKMMKAVENALAGEPIKPISITSYEVKETLYGMTEQEFIQYAKVLPPRGTKESEATEE